MPPDLRPPAHRISATGSTLVPGPYLTVFAVAGLVAALSLRETAGSALLRPEDMPENAPEDVPEAAAAEVRRAVPHKVDCDTDRPAQGSRMTAPVGFTLVQLRYFLVAAERGSMTEASAELHIAQSAVSAAIHNLERDLQAQLFIRRRGRGLTLTPAGERLQQQARDLLARAREVEREARGEGETISGPVAVGCFVTLAPYYLPHLFSECTGRYPGIEIDVVEAETDQLVHALAAGRIDFALTYHLGLSAEADLRSETIARAPAYVIVPADHPLAGQGSVELAELSTEPLVLLDLPHSRDYFRALVAATGTAPDVRYRTRSYETVRSLVARGLGYSVLNQRPATSQTYGGGEIAELQLRDASPLEVRIASLEGVTQTARARAVMDLLREIAAARSTEV